MIVNLYRIGMAVQLVLFLAACNQSAKQPATAQPADTNKATDRAESLHPVAAEPAAKQETAQTGAAVSAFVLPNYGILDTTTGDLNGDPYPDKLLVLKKRGEDTSSDVTEHPEKRPLLILTGGADGTYKLAARNNNAVLCVDCGGVMGDPYMRMVIKNGYFSIELAGGSSWRWTRTITFRYAPGEHDWFLFKDGRGSFHAADPDKIETKLLTTKDFGQVRFNRFDVYKDQ